MRAVNTVNDLVVFLDERRRQRGWSFRQLNLAAGGVAIDLNKMVQNIANGRKAGINMVTALAAVEALGYEMVVRKKEKPKVAGPSVPTGVVTPSAPEVNPTD